MAKKKNKTIASTRKAPEKAESKAKKEDKKKKGLKKMITKYKKPKKVDKKAKKEAKPKNNVEKNIVKPKAKTEIKEVSPRPVQETDKKVKATKPPKEPRFTPQQKRKMKGALLMAIGALTLIFIGYFLFGKFFRPQPLAEILPADGTIAILEVNVDPADTQTKQFYELMKNYPVYQSENLKTLVEYFLTVNYTTDIEPWIGRKVGVAIYNETPFFFVESRNHDMTADWLKAYADKDDAETINQTEYKGRQIFKYTGNFEGSMTFVNNYLVYSLDSEIIKTLLDNLEGTKVADGDKYIKVRNNLPQGSLVFGFADYGKLLEALNKDKLFASQNGQDLLALKPFLDVFRSAGFTIFADDSRFTAQTFTSIDNTALGDEAYITFSEKYQGDLLNLANPEPIFVAGGHDLTKELNRLEDIFKSGTKTPALVFDGLLEAQKQTYFGDDIDLTNDIYPLLTGEYLLTVEGSFEEPVISVFLKLDDKNNQIPLLEKAIAEFTRVSGIFTPRIQEVTLPDGTVGKEIVASPEKINTFEGSYNGHQYTTLQIGDTGQDINYAIENDVVVFSTSDAVLKSVLDRATGAKNDGFSQTGYFEKNIKQVLRSSDEMLQVKLGAITELLNLSEDKNLATYLVPFTNFTVAKNFFTDGISTIYLIEVI